MHTKVTRRSRHQFAFWLFLSVLVFPLTFAICSLDRAFPTPNSVGEALFFPREFKYYLASDFKPRARLAAWHGRIKHALNGDNQSGNTVIVGKNGYLYSYFLQDENIARPTLNYGTIPDLTVPYDTLKQISLRLQSHHEHCERHGVIYVPLIVALKPLVLPDNLPVEFRAPLLPSSSSPLQRFLRSKFPNVASVDTLRALQNANDRAPVYYRTDSHWTDYGAYVGAQELIRYLRPQFSSLPAPYSEETSIEYRNATGGNEARARGLDGQLSDQHVLVNYTKKRQLSRTGSTNIVITDLKLGAAQTWFQCPEGELESVFVFHNSFGVAFMQHLARYFKESHFVWSKFEPQLVAHEKPTVVIQLVLTY